MVFKTVASSSKTVLDITDAYSITLSNEAMTIACNTLGEAIAGELGSAGKIKTDVVVYKGNIKLTPVASGVTPTTGEFKFVIGTPVGCTTGLIDNDTFYVNTISADSGHVPIAIHIEGEVELTKNFSWSKTKSGSSSYGVDILTSSGSTFTFNQTGSSIGIANTVLTAKTDNITNPVYVWKKDGVVQANTTNTLTVLSSDLASVPSIVYSCSVSGRANDGDIVISDSITINKTTNGIDGEDPITGYLTNESVALAADKAGTILSYSTATGTFKVFQGLTDKTGNVAVTYSLVSNTNCTGTIASTGVYSISAMTDNNATAVFKAVYGGVEVVKTFSASKSKVGVDGAITYTWIRYADTPTSGISASPTDKSYIGFAYNKLNTSATNTYGDYTWSLLNLKEESWIATKYAKQLALATTIPTFNDIVGLTPTTTKIIDDTTSDMIAAAGFNGSDYFIGVFRTNVYVGANKTVSLTLGSDDSSALYVNNIYIGTKGTALNLPLVAGWNKVELLVYEHAGAESLTTSVKLSTLVDSMSFRAGVNGANSYDLSVTPDNGLLFKFSEKGVSTGIASTILTATATNILTPTYVWRKGGVVIGGATTSSITVSSSDLSAVNSLVYSCTVTGIVNSQQVTLTDTVTVIKTVDGTSALTGYLTNESVTFAASKDGAVSSFTSGSGTFKVLQGTTEVAATFGKIDSGCVSTLNTTTGAYTITSMDSDYATVTYTATYETKTLTKVLTLAKSRVGLTGANSYNMDITLSNGNMFKFDPDGVNLGATSTTLSADTVNITGLSYQWKKNGTNISGATASTLVVPATDFASIDSAVYSCTVSGSANGSAITPLTDSVTIFKAVDGDDTVTGYLTNESTTLSATKDGTVSNFAPTGGIFKVFDGITDKTTSAVFALVSNTNCTAVIAAGTGIYSASAMTQDNATAVFKATYNGVEITKTLTLSKSRVGLTGADAYNMSVTTNNGELFRLDGKGVSIGITDTTISTNLVNMVATSYVWRKNGTIIAGATSSSYTVNLSHLSGMNTASYMCTVTGTANGVTVTVSDTISISKSSDGTSAISAVLDNDAQLISSRVDGTTYPTSYDGINSTITIYDGLNVSTGWTITITTTPGITGSQAGNKYTVTELSGDAGTITFTANKANFPEIIKKYTISKSKDGESPLTYFMELGVYSIQRDIVANVYRPENLPITSYVKQGNGGRSLNNVYFLIYEQAKDPITIDAYNTLLANGQVLIDEEYIISSVEYPYVLRYTSSVAESEVVYNLLASAKIMSIMVEMYADAEHTQLLDIETVGVTGDGFNSIGGYLTNESVNLSASTTGVVLGGDFTAANGTFKVNDGVDDVTNESAFSLVATGCTATINATTGVYSVSAMSQDNAYITMTAIYKDTTINKVMTLSKTRDGASAYDLSLSATNGVQFKFTEKGVSSGIGSTILVANVTNMTGVSYQWKKNGTNIGGATTSSYSVLSSAFGNDAHITYSCLVNGSVNDVSVQLEDATTVIKTIDGNSALSGYLTNESATVSATKDGTVSNYVPANGTFKVFFGSTDVTTQCSFTATSATCTPAIGLNTGVYSMSAMGANDTATITMTATYESTKVITKVMTVSKAKVGLDGAAAEVLVLSSDTEVMTYNYDGTTANPASQTATLTAKLQNIAGTATFTATPYNSAGTALAAITLGGSGNTRTLTNAQFLATAGTVRVVVTATLGAYSDKVTITQLKAGTDAKSLYLTSTSQLMTYDTNGTALPASQTISFTANLQNITGTATFTATPYNAAGTALTVITLGGSGNTRTLTNAQFTAATGAVRVLVSATLSGFTDTITVTKVQDGVSSYIHSRYLEVGYINELNGPCTYTTGATTVEVTDIGWKLTSSSIDPTITMYPIGSFDPTKYKFFGMKYRVVSGTNSGYEVFFTNTTNASANSSYMKSGSNLVSDGQWHTAFLDMSSHANWATGGNITGWRWDWATVSGVIIEFAWVGLFSALQETPSDFIGTITGSAATGSTDINVYEWIKVKGENAVFGYLTNESATLAADKNGTIIGSYTPASGTFKVMDGLYAITNNVTYSVNASSGITGSITSGGLYTVSAMTTDTATVEFKAIYNNVVMLKTLTVSRSKTGADGEDAVVGYLTNESSTLASTVTGTIIGNDYTPASGTFKVFNGLDPVASSIAFSVISNTGITGSIHATSGAYTVSAMVADNATVVFRAVYSGVTPNVTIDKTLSIAKSKTGEGVYNMSVEAPGGTIFKTNGSGANIGMATTTINTILTNIAGASYIWYKNNVVISGQTASSLPVAFADVTSESVPYKCQVTGTANGKTVVVTDVISILKVSNGADGEDPVTGFLTNESLSIPTDSAGLNGVYTEATGTFRVFEGLTEITTLARTTFSYTSSANYTVSITSLGVFTVTFISNSLKTVTIPLICTDSVTGLVLTKQLTVTKSPDGLKGATGSTGGVGPQGNPGNDAVVMTLTNDTFNASVDKDGNALVGSYTGANTTIEIYKGSTKLATTGWTYSVASTTGTVTGTVSASGVYTLTNIVTDTATVTLRAVHATYGTFTKIFSVARTKTGATGATGAAAVSKWVEVNTNSVVKSITKVYTPSSITVSGKIRTGNGLATALTARYRIDEMNDTTVVTAGTLTGSLTSTSHTITSTSINSLNVYMYDTDGTTLLDMENVSIVKDGNNSYGMNLTTNNGTLFTFNESNTSTGIANTTITPVFTNFTATSYAWSWSGGSATTASLTISSSAFASAASIVYTLVVTGTANGTTGITITDAITLNKTKDGASSYSISISNETTSFPTDEDGILLDTLASSGNTSTVYLYKGTTSLTPTLTLAVSGCTATSSGAVVTINSLTANSGYVDITVKDGTTTIGIKRFSFAKVKQGETTYSWKAYADDEFGTGITQNPMNKKFMGFAINKLTSTPSANPLDYTWNAMYDLLALDEITLENRDFVEGNPVFTDKAQVDSVVHTAIDGKSYQSSLTATPTVPSTITDLDTAVNIVSSVGKRNLILDSNAIVTQPNNTGLGTAALRSDEAIPYYRVTATTTVSTFENPIYSYMSSNCTVGSQYTISVDVRIPNNGTVGFISNLGATSGILANVWTRIKYTFTYSAGLRVGGNTYSGTQLDYRNWKLESGSVMTAHTPAPEDIEYNVSTNGIFKNRVILDQPIRNIGTLEDELFLDVDSVWKVRRKILKLVYNGTESWNFLLNTNGTTASFWNANVLVKNNAPVMATHFTYVTYTGSYNARTTDQIAYYVDPAAAFMITTNKANTVATWKTFLAAEYAAGRPLSIYLPLINPTIEVLSGENQEVLNNIATFSGDNYVYTVNNLTPDLHVSFKSKGWYRNFKLQNDSRETLNALNNLESTILPALEDGILSEGEINNIKLTQKQLNIAHLDIINRYSEVVKMAKIETSVLSSLISVKTTYDTDYSNLSTTISSILNLVATETLTVMDQLVPLRTSLINYFNAYEISIGVLSTSIQMALNSSVSTSINDVNSKFSDYVQSATWEQDKNALKANISKSGGINIIRNSIGWNWYTVTPEVGVNYYWISQAGKKLMETVQSPELGSLGFGSAWEAKVIAGNTLVRDIRQVVSLPYLGTYTISFYMKKPVSLASNSDAFVKVLNNSGTEIASQGLATGTANVSSDYIQYKQTFTATSLSITIVVSVGYSAHAIISGIMLNVGSEALVWTPHSQEVYNSNIMMDINGITVGNNSTANKTVITPYKFSGYSGDEEIFTLNGDTTKVKKLQAQERFIMDPLSIIAIDNANHSGWAFV